MPRASFHARLVLAFVLAGFSAVIGLGAALPFGAAAQDGCPTDWPTDSLEIMAPAAPGGGWDTTAREVQRVLTEEQIVGQSVEVFNVEGSGGTIGLAQLATENSGNENMLMMMGLVMIGGIQLNQSPVTLDQITPVARLTTEFEVIVVPVDSPYQTLDDLITAFQADPGSISWGGGSAGGTDHILVGLIAQATGVDPTSITYVPYSGGGEALAAILGGQVTAGVSGVSEWQAQIESGEGNPTVLVLEAVARGLGLTLFDLLPLGESDAAQVRLGRRLRRLSAEELSAVARFLDTGEAHGPQRARRRRISLIGLRGAGKTTLGAALAARLGCPFIELDKLVEREHGAGVSMLFEVYGQATFRRYEREALERVVGSHESAVIATAGGIVADEDSFALLRAATHVVWLKASPAEHMSRVMEQGDFRPMGRNREAMKDLIAILEAREPE